MSLTKWGEVIDNVVQYPLHIGQTKALMDPARFVAAIAGTGGGKTVIGPLKMLKEFSEIAKRRNVRDEPIKAMVVAPTYKVMTRATLPEFLKVFDKSPWRGEYKKADGIYICAGGVAIVYIVSADSAGSLEGGQIDLAWLDEGGQMSYDAWIALVGRLGIRIGRAFITTTPYSLNWLKTKFVDLVATDPVYSYHQWASISNPVYPMEVYEHAKRSMSPARFQMRYHGDFSVPWGLVYPELFDADRGLVRDFKPSDLGSGYKVGGMDMGWSPDPRVTIVGVKTPPVIKGLKNHLWFYYERYEVQEETSEHVTHIPADARYWIDSSVGETLRLLRKAGINVRKNRMHSIQEGIDSVTARLRTGGVTIHPRLMMMLKEASGFKWPMEEDVLIGDQPEGEYGDHAMDAFRYVIGSEDAIDPPYMLGRAA